MSLAERRKVLAPVVDMMVKMYNAGGGGATSFKNVAHIIAKGIENPSEEFLKAGYDAQPVPDSTSVLMAHARETMIDGVLEKIMNDPKSSVGEPGTWKVLRSDSGNTSSGLKSDLDQTMYVLKKDAQGRWVHAPEGDRALREAFNSTWGTTPDTQGLTLEMLDIATIEGRNRFPDPRAYEVSEYKKLYQGTIVELRNTPGAYTTYGAVLQQMQLRALAGIVQGQNPRMGQVYGHDAEGKNWAKQPDFDPDLALSTLFGADANGKPYFPELIPGLAFGAAVANFLELEHYMDAKAFATKYHLRTWDDALFTRDLVRGKATGPVGKKRDYIDLSPAERAEANARLLGELFADDPGAQRRHALAMDISGDMRLFHKGEDYFGKITAFQPDRLANIAALKGKSHADLTPLEQNQAMFDALARELFPKTYHPDRTDAASLAENAKIIAIVEGQHRQLAREFNLRSIFSTAGDAIGMLFATDGKNRGWIEPEKVRHLLLGAPEDGTKPPSDAEWRRLEANLHSHLEYTLLYALYDMGPVEAKALIAHLKKSLPREHKSLAADLDQLYKRSQRQGWESLRDFSGVYARFYANQVRGNMARLSEQVQRHVLAEFGFDGVEDARMAGKLLAAQDLTWNWRKAARNTVWDPGSFDAIAQVVRTFFESGGDPDRVLAKVLDELLLAVPVLGQLESARRGGLVGVVLIGAVIQFPPIGGAMLVYSLGEAAYAIYDVEYAQPRSDNLHNAVYRGFAGSELVLYGEPSRPVVLWDVEQANELTRIDAMERELDLLHVSIPQLLIAGKRDEADAAARRAEELGKSQKTRLERRRELLSQKEQAEAVARDPALGGMITGAGAVDRQARLENFLLADVTPRIGFFVKSTVDLSVLDAVDDALAKELAEGGSSTDVGDRPADHPRKELLRSYEAMERERLAERYRKAKTLAARLETQLELRYRFKQDSLYPWFRATRGEPSEAAVGAWVDEWFTTHENEIIHELMALGLLDSDALTWRARRAAAIEAKKAEIMRGAASRGGTIDWDRIDLSHFEFPGPPIDLDLLKARTLVDMERSRQLMAAYLDSERERISVGRRNLARAQSEFERRAARPNAAGLAASDDFQDMLTALRWAAAPRHEPRMRATLVLTPLPGEEEPSTGEDAEEDEEGATPEPPEHPEYDWSMNVRLSVDPTLYYPPYNTEHRVVASPEQAERAVSSGKLGGVPLLKGVDRTIEQLLATHRSLIEEERGRFILISAFAPDMADLSATPPAAYRHLPSAKSKRLGELPAGDRPLGRTSRGYLIAQAVGFLDTPPLPEPEEPEEEVEEEEVPPATPAGFDPSTLPAAAEIERVAYVIRVAGAGWVPHWAGGSFILQGANEELLWVPRDEQPEARMQALRDRLDTDPCEAEIPGLPGKYGRPMIWNSGPQITLVDGPFFDWKSAEERKQTFENTWEASEEDGPSLGEIRGRASCN